MPKTKTTETQPIKLNRDMRDQLRGLLNSVTLCPGETAAVDRAYATAAPLIRAMVEKRYPPADMAILKKYNGTNRRRHVYVSGVGVGGYSEFTFRTSEEWVTTPVHVGDNGTFIPDERTGKAFEAWVRAVAWASMARTKVYDAYSLLITQARTLEQVEAVWPDAAKIRPHSKAALPSVYLSAEAIALIQADAAARARAEKAAERKAAA